MEFLNDVAPFEMLAALSRTGNTQQRILKKKNSRAPRKSLARMIDLGTLWLLRKQSDTGWKGAQSGIGSGIGTATGARLSRWKEAGGYGKVGEIAMEEVTRG